MSKVQVVGKLKEVLLHCDIIGTIATLSSKNKLAVDMDKVMTYPLAPVSIPLFCADV
jgi:hypothetical protein